MLIFLVLGYKKFPWVMGIYLERLTLGVKIKTLRNPWAYIRGILWYILILRFRLEIIYLDNNEYSYILLNKFFLSSVEEGIK